MFCLSFLFRRMNEEALCEESARHRRLVAKREAVIRAYNRRQRERLEREEEERQKYASLDGCNTSAEERSGVSGGTTAGSMSGMHPDQQQRRGGGGMSSSFFSSEPCPGGRGSAHSLPLSHRSGSSPKTRLCSSSSSASVGNGGDERGPGRDGVKNGSVSSSLTREGGGEDKPSGRAGSGRRRKETAGGKKRGRKRGAALKLSAPIERETEISSTRPRHLQTPSHASTGLKLGSPEDEQKEEEEASHGQATVKAEEEEEGLEEKIEQEGGGDDAEKEEEEGDADRQVRCSQSPSSPSQGQNVLPCTMRQRAARAESLRRGEGERKRRTRERGEATGDTC